MMNDWKGQRVLIIGAGRQGTALARYLVNHGAEVTINDKKDATQLDTVVQALGDVPVNWVLGGHPVSLLDNVDLLCVSGGVPLSIPLVQEAMARQIPLSNDSQIFMEEVPCTVIGITGSAGKTTTTTLVGNILTTAAKEEGLFRKVWVGGNIGNPLIANLDDMQAGDMAVMELSSFQLEIMYNSPPIAAILNITPNHLDRHKTMDAYVAAKKHILEYQDEEGIAVLNRDDRLAWELQRDVKGYLFSFGLQDQGYTGAFVDREMIKVREGNYTWDVIHRDKIKLLGQHNLMNVLASVSIAMAVGVSAESMCNAIGQFDGVEHRLEFVRRWKGADWYNDSIATAPERSIAAMRSFDRPILLLAGGRDKDLPWEEFAEVAAKKVRHLIIFGEAQKKIHQAVKPVFAPTQITLCKGLKDAVEYAANVVEAGDVVLLSPGGTSFDEFEDFAARGEAFKQWVMDLR